MLCAEGMLTESFNPGPNALKMIRPALADEVIGIVAELAGDPGSGYGPLARAALTRREAEELVSHCCGQNGPVAVSGGRDWARFFASTQLTTAA